MNPNEYDDAAYLRASIEFQNHGTGLFLDLWDAGADATNIIDEVNNALAEAGITNSLGDGPLELQEK